MKNKFIQIPGMLRDEDYEHDLVLRTDSKGEYKTIKKVEIVPRRVMVEGKEDIPSFFNQELKEKKKDFWKKIQTAPEPIREEYIIEKVKKSVPDKIVTQ